MDDETIGVQCPHGKPLMLYRFSDGSPWVVCHEDGMPCEDTWILGYGDDGKPVMHVPPPKPEEKYEDFGHFSLGDVADASPMEEVADDGWGEVDWDRTAEAAAEYAVTEEDAAEDGDWVQLNRDMDAEARKLFGQGAAEAQGRWNEQRRLEAQGRLPSSRRSYDHMMTERLERITQDLPNTPPGMYWEWQPYRDHVNFQYQDGRIDQMPWMESEWKTYPDGGYEGSRDDVLDIEWPDPEEVRKYMEKIMREYGIPDDPV